jgi:uncharacterized protein
VEILIGFKIKLRIIMKNFQNKSVLFVSIFIVLSFNLSAQQLPKPRGYVNDFANVIPASQEQQINRICLELKQKTGAEIADVTIQTLGDNYIEDYAVRLFETWGIGEKGKDNGVLILNAIKEKKIRIEVGYGIEGIIPDGKAGRIRDLYLIPHLKKGDFGTGHLYTVAAIAKEIANEYEVELTGNVQLPRSRSSRSKGRGPGGFLGILFVIFLIIITRGRIIPWLLLGSMLGGGSNRGGGGFGGSGGFGGGFGGFGGGMSGGGGASGSY